MMETKPCTTNLQDVQILLPVHFPCVLATGPEISPDLQPIQIQGNNHEQRRCNMTTVSQYINDEARVKTRIAYTVSRHPRDKKSRLVSFVYSNYEYYRVCGKKRFGKMLNWMIRDVHEVGDTTIDGLPAKIVLIEAI